MMSKNAKRKILTAAVIFACTSLWASPVWAATGGREYSDGAYYGERNTLSNGLVEGEEVVVEEGDSFKGVYGGYAFEETMGWDGNIPKLEGTSQANNNIVTINGGTITSAKITELSYNSRRKTIYGSIAGAWSNNAFGNKVIMNAGNFIGLEASTDDLRPGVYGAIVLVKDNNNKEHTNIAYNSVYIGREATVSGGNVAGVYVESLRQNGNNNIIKNNSVVIDGATIQSTSNLSGNIYGAYSIDENSVLENNIVTIKGGTIVASDAEYGGGIYGAWGDSEGSVTNNNTVIIEGGEITANIYGAFGRIANDEDSNKDDDIDDSVIAGNKVVISGGTINGTVYAADTRQLKGFLKNNGIEISGNNADLTNTNLAGYKDNSKIEKSENIYLNINNFSGTEGKIKGIENFNTVNITDSIVDVNAVDYVDVLNIKNENKNIVNLGKVNTISDNSVYNFQNRSVINTDSKIKAQSLENLKALNVDMTAINWEKDTAVVDVSGTADFTGTSISASGTLAAAAGTEVQNGDRMSFIKAGELKGVSAADVDIDKLQIGFATEAKVEMQDDGNSIDFVITGAQQANEQAGIIGESRTAAIAFVNQGSDILNNAFGLMDDGKYGIKTFAAAHGNYSKYETGSHIRVNGWSMIAGVGNSDKLEDGTFSWGVFFENGSGNYRTYNDYNGYNLRGFGSAVYNGGGALARYRSNAGNYAEIGLRAGMLKNSLGNAVADGYGVQGGYDEETSYYGAHLGVGHIFAVDENSNVDVYGKYFYNHHESEDLNILGDEVRFDSADSNRLRLGLRYNQNDGNAFSHYYGLAWDYEFSGDANVTAAGFDTGNPSLKGSTAVIEAGIHYAPDNSPWSIDLGLQGYGGQRDGFSGTMQLNYSFN